MNRIARKISKFLHKVPGHRFGLYRFLPLFFLLGAALEFTMIHWHFRGVNFYKTFKRRRAEEIARRELSLEFDAIRSEIKELEPSS